MTVIADDKQIAATIDRLAGEVEAVMKRTEGAWAIVGMRSRGDELARRLSARLKPRYTGTVDIGLYRDDLSAVGPQPTVRTTELHFPIDGTNVLLVDDVLMSGRSVRAALQSLIDFGRPRCVKLLVLVDRGRRELPIAPDFVGLRVNTDGNEQVVVTLKPGDPEDQVAMIKRPEDAAARPRMENKR